MKIFCFTSVAFAALALASSQSYLPPYIEGDPLSMSVIALDPPDIRHEPVYRIEFTVQEWNKENPKVIPGIVHRTYKEFQKLDEILVRVGPRTDEIVLPTEEEANVETLNAYLSAIASYPGMLDTVEVEDFLGINWSGQDFTYMNSLEGFMDMLLLHRMPHFMPEPAVIASEEDVFAPETPFEAYVFIQSFRHDKRYTEEYLQFLTDYTDQTPAFEGLPDDEDVWAPGQVAPLDYPTHYNMTYVHFLPGGYMNGHTVRINYLGKNKFSFLDESRIREWLLQLYPDITPQRILDVGTGGCFSAFVLGELFPNAEVVAVDMAAPAVRFCRLWKEQRGATNVEFYQGNGEDLFFLESESFDFINYAYVLHEMPAENARRVVQEMHRLLKPGGILNGFEVPHFDDPIAAGLYTLFNTWGYKWDVPGKHGPEPYIGEYLNGTQLPHTLEETGFEGVEVLPYSFFESIFLSRKPSVH